MNTAWMQTTLGDECDLYQPQTLAKSDLDNEGPFLVYGANGVIGKHSKFNHKDPQVLVTCRGATCGTVNVSSANAWINGNAMVVRPKHDQIHFRFLMHYLKTGVNLQHVITGAAQPQITRQSLSPLKISLPPLAEQQRIAEILDTADRLMQLRESVIAKLDQLAQSVFVKKLNQLSSNKILINEIAEMYQPKTISTSDLVENGKYVVYGANGIIGRYDKFNHDEDEVLVTCRGATCGTVNRSQPFSWITGNAMVVKPLSSYVTKDYLEYYFKYVADFSSVITGAAQPQITRQTLSRLLVEIPNANQQNEITKAVKEVRKKRESMLLPKIKLDELLLSLQHQSFAVN